MAIQSTLDELQDIGVYDALNKLDELFTRLLDEFPDISFYDGGTMLAFRDHDTGRILIWADDSDADLIASVLDRLRKDGRFEQYAAGDILNVHTAVI